MHAWREAVAEFQGLYGPFTIAERVLQKIWLRQDFDGHAARLADGRALEPGQYEHSFAELLAFVDRVMLARAQP